MMLIDFIVKEQGQVFMTCLLFQGLYMVVPANRPGVVSSADMFEIVNKAIL
jgi:hypothetical protein